MRKQALFILSRYLWPVDGGRKESLKHYIKELYDNYNYKITILCFLEAGQKVKKSDIPYYIDAIYSFEDTSLLEKIKNVMFFSFFGKKWPIQCSLYYSKKNIKIIEGYFELLKPKLIFTEMIRTCMYIDAFRDKCALKLANIDDLLSLRYKRQLSSSAFKSNYMGAYENKFPKWINSFFSSRFIKSIVLNIESKRCELWENNFYKDYDFILLTSDKERDALNKRMCGNKAKTLSVGVDCNYYSEQFDVVKESNTLSFVGNFFIPSNIDSLRMIVKNVFPFLDLNFRFYLIGKYPDFLKKEFAGNEHIIFCGRVDDLRKYVKKTSVFFAPISYGTGIKTKIVEAMAMGMPIITNSVGVEGINADIGKDILVYDDYEEMANAIKMLFTDNFFRERLGFAAQNFAKRNFRWEKVFDVYKEMNL